MNQVLFVCILAWAIAQTMKYPIYYLKTGQSNIGIIFSTGSMPSSHTAIVTSLALEVGKVAGWNSPVFAVAFVLASIVIHDAVKVRGESGKQAQIINKLVESLDFHVNFEKRQERLKELIGHTTSEVIGGFVVGLVVFLIYNLF